MEVAPYITFKGECAEAFKFYEQCLGGKIVMMQTHGDSPMKDHVPADWQDKIMHVRLEADGMALMGSDAPPDHYAAPQGIHISVSTGESDAARIFSALSQGGQVTMPYEKTFWSPGFGMLVDRFGIPWMVNAEHKP
jgi:PhnB protein